MSQRRSYRAVFAEVLLAAAPVELAVRSDGVSLRVEFATIAELRRWLAAAGLPSVGPAAEHEGVFTDGRRYRAMNAYPTWHGWKVYASATEVQTTTPELTADEAAGLAGIVQAAA